MRIQEKPRREEYEKLCELEDSHTKVCPGCLGLTPLDDFGNSKTHRKGHQSYCKACGRASYLRNKFDMDEQAYEKMVQEQEGKCAICKTTEPSWKGRIHWSIDHCHVTGKVRGLLCNDCNVAIGRLNDDPNLLRKAAEYLEAHNNG